MKIISGKYKGKIIKGFAIDGTRPTMDRVKESLFAMIQDYVKGSIVLDLFAGSGNLGLEALSNGAIKAIFVDKNHICTNTIRAAIKEMNVAEETLILNRDYQEAIKFLENSNIKVNIVFLDPPYHENILNKSLELLAKSNILKEKSLIVAEYESEDPICNLEVIKERKYGSKKIRIYQKNL